jgi:autophagy-related protein 9
MQPAALHNGMFDDDFSIRASFYDVAALRLRMRYLAVANLLLSPFLAIFMVMYFLLHNAEKFYHQPSSVGHRQWSTHAWWRLREFNELSHFTEHRLAAAHKPATRYVAQFPSPVVSMVAKFVSYIVGAFAAIAIGCALMDDRLLHAEVFGRDLLWFTAVMGTVLAASRGMIGEENRVFEPNRLMGEVVGYTHYLPRHWRNLAHNQEVQAEFEGMFQFKAGLFWQEMLSIFAVPFILWYPMCASAPDIVQFVRQFTVHRQGVGHICSLSAFDFRRHGNSKYGAPMHARKPARSKQGKMEKSFLSFHAHYPTWEPDASGREMLSSLAGFRSSMHGGGGGGGGGAYDGGGMAAAASGAFGATGVGAGAGARAGDAGAGGAGGVDVGAAAGLGGGGGGVAAAAAGGGGGAAAGGGGGAGAYTRHSQHRGFGGSGGGRVPVGDAGAGSQRFVAPGTASMFFDHATSTTSGGGGGGGAGAVGLVQAESSCVAP